MKSLDHRAIFLQTLDGFFAPLVGAFKGAAAEMRRASSKSQTFRTYTADQIVAMQKKSVPEGPKIVSAPSVAKKRRSKIYKR